MIDVGDIGRPIDSDEVKQKQKKICGVSERLLELLYLDCSITMTGIYSFVYSEPIG